MTNTKRTCCARTACNGTTACSWTADMQCVRHCHHQTIASWNRSTRAQWMNTAHSRRFLGQVRSCAVAGHTGPSGSWGLPYRAHGSLRTTCAWCVARQRRPCLPHQQQRYNKTHSSRVRGTWTSHQRNPRRKTVNRGTIFAVGTFRRTLYHSSNSYHAQVSSVDEWTGFDCARPWHTPAGHRASCREKHKRTSWTSFFLCIY